MHKRHTEAERFRLFGFRFLATVFSRAQGIDKNYMEETVPDRVISLDKTEGYFKALAEAAKHRG